MDGLMIKHFRQVVSNGMVPVCSFPPSRDTIAVFSWKEYHNSKICHVCRYPLATFEEYQDVSKAIVEYYRNLFREQRDNGELIEAALSEA